jgi:hypothetical protein
MSEHQRHTAFLRHCIRYEDTAERKQLEESISQIQHDERSVRRAVWLMVLLMALAMAGLCYSVVFLDDYPQRTSQFVTRSIVKVFCALGLGSLISLMAFVGLGAVYRKRLDRRREECRKLAMVFFESRLSKPVTTLLRDIRDNRVGEGDGRTVRVANEVNGSVVKIESAARG